MLILTRRVGETIVIGDKADLRVTVLGVKGNQVRIGITAPESVPVHREEIYERIQREKSATSEPPAPQPQKSAEANRGLSLPPGTPSRERYPPQGPEFVQGARVVGRGAAHRAPAGR